VGPARDVQEGGRREVHEDRVAGHAHEAGRLVGVVDQAPVVVEGPVLDDERHLRLRKPQVEGLAQPVVAPVLYEEEAGEPAVGLQGGAPVGVRVVPVGRGRVVHGELVAVGVPGVDVLRGVAVHLPGHAEAVPVYGGVRVEPVQKFGGEARAPPHPVGGVGVAPAARFDLVDPHLGPPAGEDLQRLRPGGDPHGRVRGVERAHEALLTRKPQGVAEVAQVFRVQSGIVRARHLHPRYLRLLAFRVRRALPQGTRRPSSRPLDRQPVQLRARLRSHRPDQHGAVRKQEGRDLLSPPFSRNISSLAPMRPSTSTHAYSTPRPSSGFLGRRQCPHQAVPYNTTPSSLNARPPLPPDELPRRRS
jgi:hypothetical protein